MEPKVNQVKHTLALQGDEADLLRTLVESLASKEGLVVEHKRISKHGDYHLNLGASAGKSLVLLECTRAPDKKYNLNIRRLSDAPEAHGFMESLTDFIKIWYSELRKSFFR